MNLAAERASERSREDVVLEEVETLKAIKSVMDTIDPQWMQKLISTSTDGATVMMGRIAGVI